MLLELKLVRAERLLDTDLSAARALHHELRADLSRALAALRELAQSLYPVVLDHDGLPGALRHVAGRVAIPVTVVFGSAERYPPEVEAAVYFFCREALENADKHAGPGAEASVAIARHDGVLRFEVSDDGAGFVTSGTPGVGVQNMRDRIAALGGAFELSSRPGGGTTVSATLPV